MKAKITNMQKKMLMDGKSLTFNRRHFCFSDEMKEEMKPCIEHEWKVDTDTLTVIIGAKEV